jgi:hypothetical protein
VASQVDGRAQRGANGRQDMIPGGFGLLYLARGLALSRTIRAHHPEFWLDWKPDPRWYSDPLPMCREYYAILDRISRGEKP